MATFGEQWRHKLQQKEARNACLRQYNIAITWKRIIDLIDAGNEYVSCSRSSSKNLTTFDLMTIGLKMLEQKFPDVDILVHNSHTQKQEHIQFITNEKFANIYDEAKKEWSTWDQLFLNKISCDKYDETHQHLIYEFFHMKSWKNPFLTIEEYNQN
jgi:hypothetical protein